MNYCKQCCVVIENKNAHCPLCGRGTKALSTPDEKDYPAHLVRKKIQITRRIFVFLSITFGSVYLLLDHLLPENSFWMFLTFGILLYIIFTTYTILYSYQNVGRLIFLNILAFSGLCVFVDLQTGTYLWSVNYIIPFLSILGTTILMIITLVRPLLLRDYFLYLLITSLFGLSAIGLLLLDIPTVRWPASVAALYSGLTLLGSFLFREKRSRHELRKRFHF